MKHTNIEYVEYMTCTGERQRPWFTELFGPLSQLCCEWKAQGATDEMIGMTAFGFDYVPYYGVGNTSAINLAPTKVLEDTPYSYAAIDGLGRKIRLDRRTASIPLPETFPVSCFDDWLEIKHHYMFDECRIDHAALEKAVELQKQGTVIVVNMCGGYDTLRDLMGDEGCCLAFFEEPDLVCDIFDTIGEMTEKVFERITEVVVPDQISIHEDMAGKSGPLVGPNIVDEFIAPYYRRCMAPCKAKGTKLVCQDSDGNMNPLIDSFIACGVNLFYPCEPAAGMDIVEMRKKYGSRICMRGGIDKHVLRKTKADIDRELEYKLQPMMLEGGTIFGLDHRITNGTPLENYIYYIDRAREILGLPDFRQAEKGWNRMAF